MHRLGSVPAATQLFTTRKDLFSLLFAFQIQKCTLYSGASCIQENMVNTLKIMGCP